MGKQRLNEIATHSIMTQEREEQRAPWRPFLVRYSRRVVTVSLPRIKLALKLSISPLALTLVVLG